MVTGHLECHLKWGLGDRVGIWAEMGLGWVVGESVLHSGALLRGNVASQKYNHLT